MHMLQKLGRFARSLWCDRRGNVALYWTVAAVPVIMAVGVAVDVSRAYFVRERLYFALDAAGLAVGSSQGTQAEMEAVMQAYFDANYPAEALGVPATPVLNLVESNGITTITVSGEASIGTTFMRVAGIDDITVGSSIEVTQETEGLELVLVLDVTGSMYGSKIAALRQASRDLIDILYGNETEKEFLKVGIVPYAATVNPGSIAPSLVPSEAANYDPTNEEAWKGCVLARTYPHDSLDSSVADGGAWQRYNWQPAKDNWWPPANNTESLGNDRHSPNLGCPNAIVPLTNQRAVLEATINALISWHRGGTFSNIGMVWGWRVISPEEPFTEALPYNTPKYDKAVILMTDGENLYYQLPKADYHVPLGKNEAQYISDYAAYRRLDDGVLGTTSKTTARNILNARLEEVCDQMAAQGIIIYTVTFQLSDATTLGFYERCAANGGRHFDAPTADDLREDFQEIADELKNLRVSR
jgi:Flp pilus assembly protein TadG